MNWFKHQNFLAICTCLILSACSTSKSIQKDADSSKYIFPYNLDSANVFELDKDLNEISGLSYEAKEDALLAIEDEHGIIYKLNKVDGSIMQRDTFYKDGDYEGIANTEDFIYVVKSSGTIYEVIKSNLKSKPSKKKSFISKKQETEGITYDSVTNSLYVCNKESGDNESKNQRRVYQYDLQTDKMIEEPFLIIDRVNITNFLKENYSVEYAQENFKKILNSELDYLHLGPSAIAFHPQNRDVYVLSSKSKVLLVFDGQSKELKLVRKLNKEIFIQPEGICFDNKSNLYISSEGKSGNAKLIVVAKQ